MTDAQLLAAYRSSVWTVAAGEPPAAVRLDRPAPLDPALLPAGLVTAYNPASVRRPDAVNRADQARLRDDLLAAGGSLVPGVAGGTGAHVGMWTEPCYLVSELPRDRLVELAGRYGQNAIVWIEPGGTPTLVATRAGFCGARPGDTL